MAKYESLSQAREDLDYCDRCEFCDGCKTEHALCDAVLCDWCGEERSADERIGEYQGDRLVCGDCQDADAEAAFDLAMERFYGGDGPATLAERAEEASKFK